MPVRPKHEMFESKGILPFPEIRKKWLQRLVIAICLSPIAIAIYSDDQIIKQRTETLTQIFNVRQTPEAFRPHIERVVEHKVAACEDISRSAGMSEGEILSFLKECEAVQANIADNFEYHPK